MSPDDITLHLQWRATSGHPGGWRVTRQDFRLDAANRHLQELERKDGRVLLFRTYEGAHRRAAELNAR